MRNRYNHKKLLHSPSNTFSPLSSFFQHNLGLKLVAFSLTAYLGMLALSLRRHPNQLDNVGLNTTNTVASVYIPTLSRTPLYWLCCTLYGIDSTEMRRSFSNYASIGQLLMREIKERPIEGGESSKSICSPSDSSVIKICEITGETYELIKNGRREAQNNTGITNAKQESRGNTKACNQTPKNTKQRKIYQIEFKVSLSDYQRFHAPVGFEVERVVEVEGMQLDFQKQLLAARGDTKDKHSLVYVEGEGKDGYIGLAVVGAPKVDKKEIKQAESFVKGQQIGYFGYAPTVVLLIESEGIKQWSVQVGQKVRYGQKICEML